jgi:hypothetical protein
MVRQAGQQGQAVGRGAVRLGVVDEQHQAGGAGDSQLFQPEVQQAELRMVEEDGAAGPGADVVACPQAAELLAVHGQFTDQSCQSRVVRTRTGVGAQPGSQAHRQVVPIPVQVTDGRVEERLTQQIGALAVGRGEGLGRRVGNAHIPDGTDDERG